MQLDTHTDIVIDEADMEIGDYNLGVEIAKSLTISAAQTAGVVGGFFVIAVAFEVGLRLRMHFKKTTPDLYVVTDLPKAAEN
jgi:hypothetical protein